MVKSTKKPGQKQNNIINNVLVDNKTSQKSKQQIDKEYYQKNKEHKRQQRRERYQQQKKQEKKQLNKYYQASNIKILMSFKNYTELSKEKRKLWTDFNWTMKDCQTSIKDSLADIVAIMKLVQVADNLIKDYWETAKSEERKLSKSWNSLDYDQQQRLIKYWGYEKARIENNFLTTAEELERKSQSYLKDIELAKFHEERGKVKCPCYQCQESKRIQGKIKQELFKEDKTEKEQCPECKKWVECKSCEKRYK